MFKDGCIAKNTVISPNFMVWKFCAKAQFPHSLGESPETMRKLCLSTKFPHQEIKWNYDIFLSVGVLVQKLGHHSFLMRFVHSTFNYLFVCLQNAKSSFRHYSKVQKVYYRHSTRFYILQVTMVWNRPVISNFFWTFSINGRKSKWSTKYASNML